MKRNIIELARLIAVEMGTVRVRNRSIPSKYIA